MHYTLLCVLLIAVACASAGNGNGNGNGNGGNSCLSYRSFDGYCNNAVRRTWGQANQYLTRGAEGTWFEYENGVRKPVLTPNLRTVSNELFRADDAKLHKDGLNLFWTFFGQFITHDMLGVHRRGDNPVDLQEPTTNTSVWTVIALEHSNDAFYSVIPRITVPYLRVLRSRGETVNGVFEVGSDSSSYLDLDIVYGKEDHVAQLLRKFEGGELKSRVYRNYTAVPGTGTGASTVPQTWIGNFGEWLPLVNDVDPNRTHIPISPQLVLATTQNVPLRFFASGDGRNGENYALNVLQGLFHREHNRIARATKAAHPSWSDDKIYNHARKVNIAQYQSIVLYEYLPSLLKKDYKKLVKKYDGYDLFTDASVSQLFAFAFRFGHTTVPNTYKLKNKCGGPAFNSTRDGPRSGQAAGTAMPADQMAQVGEPENILHAILFEGARDIDLQFPESLRSIPGANADILVQNQLRAAENGIPDYHTIRKLWHGGRYPSVYSHPDCNATETSSSPDPIGCWGIFTANATAALRLQQLYGKLNKLNFYTAVVGEDPIKGGAVIGQTSAHIVADQFVRARDGDRWWFENVNNGLFTKKEAKKIKDETTMNALLERNFNMSVPYNAFYVPKPRFFKHCKP